MELSIAVKGRRSVRKFTPDEVPENIIREIIEDARWAPSGGNTQPWELHIAVGESLKRFKEANRRNFLEGVPANPDVVIQEVYPDAMRDRYQALAKQTFGSQGITREDRQARRQYNAGMFAILDAPCLILFCLDKALSLENTMLDIGMLLQTVCLLAYERGLGTCILGVSVRYPDLVRQILSVPENKNVVIGVALGYPNVDASINNFQRERAELAEFVFWSK